MLDPKLLRSELEQPPPNSPGAAISWMWNSSPRLETQRKTLQVRTQELQNERNTRSKAIGRAKASGQDIQPLLDQVAYLGDPLKQTESELEVIQTQLLALQLGIPNIPHDSTPTGASEADNAEIRRWGEPRQFEFQPRDHVDLGGEGGLDFEAGARADRGPFRRDPGPTGAAAPGADSIHARSAYPRAWLPGNLRTLHGQRRQPARHRPIAEVRGRPVQAERRIELLPDSHRRGASHQPGARPLSWTRISCHCATSAIRPVFAAKPVPMARTCAA